MPLPSSSEAASGLASRPDAGWRLAILVSGRGSNMEAILRRRTDLNGEIVGVISSRSTAAAIGIATQLGIPVSVVAPRAFPGREACDEATTRQLEAWGANFIALAGYMRILGDGFLRRWAGRIVNIHPSLLPSFPGVDPHEQALRRGVKVSGCTVHLVEPGPVDGGTILAQSPVPVLPGDTAATLAARVLEQEHQIYPRTLQRIFAGELAGSAF